MIVSAIDGRIRLIEPGLRTPAKADALENRLQQVVGITSASVNRKTGSLLVQYDSAVRSSRTIRKVIRQHLRASGIRLNVNSIEGAPARRYVKYGLLGTISGSIGLLLLNSEEWHYRIGTGFLTLLSVHLFQNRRRLLK